METAVVGWRRIGCAVDFSDGSRGALRLAAALARNHDAELFVVHAYIEQVDVVSEVYNVTTAEAARQARQRRDIELERWRQNAHELGAPKVQAAVLLGEPYKAIVEFAGREHLDLIVMGTHGRTGLQHLLVGSVAERVVRLAPCPVLTIGGHPPTRDSRRHSRAQPSCGEVMHRHSGFVHPHHALEEAARKMAELEVGFLPVVDAGGHLVGGITDHDVLLRLASRGDDQRAILVSDVMSRSVATCRADEDARMVADRVRQRGARRAVVLGDDRLVQGVLDQADVPAQYS